MAETKTWAGEATLGAAEESRDYLNRVSGALVGNTHQALQATQRVTGALQQVGQQFSPALAQDYQVPSPKQLIDTSYDFATRMLDLQRQLAHQWIDGFGGLYSSDETPAPEKVAQRANEGIQKVSEQARQAQEQAQQEQAQQEQAKQDGVKQDGVKQDEAKSDGAKSNGTKSNGTATVEVSAAGRGGKVSASA